MARSEHRWPRPVSGNAYRMRLASAVTLLVLTVLLMIRLRDASLWRWAGRPDTEPVKRAGMPSPLVKNSSPLPQAGEGQGVRAVGSADEHLKSRSESTPLRPDGAMISSDAPHPVPLPEREGDLDREILGTDRDSEEWDAATEEFQALSDRTLFMRKEEMEAFFRVLKWVDRQSEPALSKRARRDVEFNDLVQSPSKYRGKLIQLDLTVRRITEREGTSRHPGPLYELWGFTAQSQSWLYVADVTELPQGMPIGPDIGEKVRLVGYFLKLQGYQDGLGRPGYAPLLVGRLVWLPAAVPAMSGHDWLWAVAGVCGLGLVGLGSLLWSILNRTARRQDLTLVGRRQPGAMTTSEWLDRAQTGDLSDTAELEDSA